jgi:hypothetical protein
LVQRKDGFPDLAVGYASNGGGLVAIHLANSEPDVPSAYEMAAYATLDLDKHEAQVVNGVDVRSKSLVSQDSRRDHRPNLPAFSGVGDPNCSWTTQTNTALTSSANLSIPGQAVTFTATVSPSLATGTPRYFAAVSPPRENVLLVPDRNVLLTSSGWESAGTGSTGREACSRN